MKQLHGISWGQVLHSEGSDTPSAVLIFLTQVLCCSNSSPFSLFSPLPSQRCPREQTAKHIITYHRKSLALVSTQFSCDDPWSLWLQVSICLASVVGTRISLPNRGDRLEKSIFLRLLRRSHLASLAWLSHTPAHLYVYIRVTLHTCNLDSST